MKKIVIRDYPVDKLPPELREGMESAERVTVTVEPEKIATHTSSGALDDMLDALPSSQRKSIQHISDLLRKQRGDRENNR